MNNYSKKTVAIISSLHNSINYGAILQAYALVDVVNRLGYDTCQLLFDPAEYSHTADNKIHFAHAVHFVLSHPLMKTLNLIHDSVITTLFQRKHIDDHNKSIYMQNCL